MIHYDKGRSTLSLTKLNDFYYKDSEACYGWYDFSVQNVFSVDGMENATSFAFELDKPYTVQRDDEEEITVCSKISSPSNSLEKDNVLHYRTEVPIRVCNKWLGFYSINLNYIFTKV